MKRILSMKIIFMLFTAVLITLASIIYSASIVRVIPLYVSLFIMLLQTQANRFCFLVGGLNALFYAVVYFSSSLYGLALSALCVSSPLQLITFIQWSKRSYGKSTLLRRLSVKERIFWAIGIITAWLILCILLGSFGSGHIILDSTVTIIGTIATIFSMLSLIEFPFLQSISTVFSIVLYISILKDNPEQITYLIFSIYSFVCSLISLRYMVVLYNKQQEERTRPASAASLARHVGK